MLARRAWLSFPSLGKFGADFSKAWKNIAVDMQEFSKYWKFVTRIFQGLKKFGRALVCLVLLALTDAAGREVTFLSTSDSHYREPDHKLGHHNDINRASI